MSSQALIDKIINTAEAEADAVVTEILRRAGENERLILSAADAECGRIIAAAEEKAAQTTRTASLMAELDARKAALHAKREVISAAYEKAFEKLVSAKDGERRGFLCALIAKYAPAARVTLTFCERDLPLIDGETLENISKALSDRFGEEPQITVSEKPGKFRGGVFMESELSVADASFESLFEELRRETEAEAERILFG